MFSTENYSNLVYFLKLLFVNKYTFTRLFMSAKYQMYKDVAGKFRFRLKAANNKIVAVSEAYEQRSGCLNGIKSVQSNCNSEIYDATIEGPTVLNPKYTIFFDAKCGYRFNLTAKNGEIIAASEGYSTKDGCINGIRAVQKSCEAAVEDLTVTRTEKPVVDETETLPKDSEKPMATFESTGIKLELAKLPEQVNAGEVIFFKGKLIGDNGTGIPNAKISIREHDRSYLTDEILRVEYTKEDGSYEIGWKAKSVDWWDDTAEIYAQYDQDKEIKHIRTEIQKIVIK